MKQKKTLTPEQRKERIEEIKAALNGAKNLTESEKAAASRIKTIDEHELSPRNQRLIYWQADTRGAAAPTLVAGFRQWIKHGREVKKGEKGYIILFPRIGNKQATDPQTGEPAGDPQKAILSFGRAYVWDISQTQENAAAKRKAARAAMLAAWKGEPTAGQAEPPTIEPSQAFTLESEPTAYAAPKPAAPAVEPLTRSETTADAAADILAAIGF